jgi:hypothetical protein
MTVKDYWVEVRAQQAELDKQYPAGVVHIAPRAGGQCTAVSTEIAARRIVEGTFRVATADDIAALDRRMAENKAIGDAATLRNLGLTKLMSKFYPPRWPTTAPKPITDTADTQTDTAARIINALQPLHDQLAALHTRVDALTAALTVPPPAPPAAPVMADARPAPALRWWKRAFLRVWHRRRP